MYIYEILILVFLYLTFLYISLYFVIHVCMSQIPLSQYLQWIQHILGKQEGMQLFLLSLFRAEVGWLKDFSTSQFCSYCNVAPLPTYLHIDILFIGCPHWKGSLCDYLVHLTHFITGIPEALGHWETCPKSHSPLETVCQLLTPTPSNQSTPASFSSLPCPREASSDIHNREINESAS